MSMFSKEDLLQIEKHGLTLQAVERQIENFRNGFPYLKIVCAASAGDGVRVLDEDETQRAVARYETAAEGLRVVKFVPASGAATRMFKELFEFVNEGRRGKGVETVLENLHRFAFWDELQEVLPKGADEREIIATIIDTGLAYGHKPKGLVTFHAYADGNRKAVEEHLVEGAMYARTGDDVHIHFTVSPDSVQKPSTDTIAVNPDNTPFRTDKGELLFRPAGHGALIENLNDIDADIIFVKNIDNVTTDARRGDTVKYKTALAGVLLMLQAQAFDYLQALEVGGADLNPIVDFIERRLCVKLPENYDSAMLKRILDRPMRVCGMVRNEGEPGGGPFWAVGRDGIESLQIAEPSQIAPEERDVMRTATYFNPVDIVCGVRNSRGVKFDLTQYTDPATGFISSKSSFGRELRAQELPGLWNGAMSDWNTVFVEVPVTTFSPVKVVTDLLRPEHQPE